MGGLELFDKNVLLWQNTKRGASNKGKGPTTKLLPIGKLLQRQILWMCGYNRYKMEAVLAARIPELEVG
jgi:hypothetical protein